MFLCYCASALRTQSAGVRGDIMKILRKAVAVALLLLLLLLLFLVCDR